LRNIMLIVASLFFGLLYLKAQSCEVAQL